MIKHKQNQTVKLWWGKILNSYKRFIDVQAIQRAPTTQRSQEANGTSRWFTEVSGKLIKVKKDFHYHWQSWTYKIMSYHFSPKRLAKVLSW